LEKISPVKVPKHNHQKVKNHLQLRVQTSMISLQKKTTKKTTSGSKPQQNDTFQFVLLVVAIGAKDKDR
jgi:hypothetical protein